ncbi:helix-turn-helix transcriptional regulator [Gephyromycinifex aptenodytis]|uniref:helix-turn-helix transcriptional regulator n=1 Tax=Gephyromycinifex aptenodytis TaxID=2716227 RepID=UPI0014455A2B|nr:helix-turn-helix domain-containing protein [Gephyromycinifex aptenodytis]
MSDTEGAPERLLSPTELSAWLGVPEATLYVWRHRGKGPAAIKVGRHLRYRRRVVESWLSSQEAGGGAQADSERTQKSPAGAGAAPRLGRQAADQQVRERAAARRTA